MLRPCGIPISQCIPTIGQINFSGTSEFPSFVESKLKTYEITIKIKKTDDAIAHSNCINC